MPSRMMNFRQKVAKFIYPELTKKVESFVPPTGEETEYPPDKYFRPLTATDKDLSLPEHTRHLRIAYYLYITNPLARRIIDILTSYVVGEGIQYTAEDETVKNVLDRFWDDRKNNFSLTQFNRIRELCLFGEQIYQVFVTPKNGHVRLGYIDPLNISEIIPAKGNPADLRKIKLGQFEELEIIDRDEDPLSPTYGFLKGQVFYFAINRVTTAHRGFSELIHLADWVDSLDQFLFAGIERSQLLNFFIMEIILQGGTQTDVDEKYKFLMSRTPKPGTFNVHTDKEEWKILAPDLKASDISEQAKVIRNLILGGAGIPPHFFAEGEYQTKATAIEARSPFHKRILALQKYFCFMIEEMFNFVIDQAIIAGVLDKNVNRVFSIVPPALAVEETGAVAETLVQLTQALTLAESNDWISKDSARELFAIVASKLGKELLTEEEKEKTEVTEDYQRMAFNLKKLIDRYGIKTSVK